MGTNSKTWPDSIDMTKTFLLAFFLLQAVGFSQAYLASECPTKLDETERKDCYPEPGASEDGCKQRGCEWCETVQGGLPWCFHNTDPSQIGNCPTFIAPEDRIDCYPEPGSTQAGCEARGCLWCSTEVQDVPWCFFGDEESSGAPFTEGPYTGPTRAPSATYEPGCASPLPPSDRVDCYPEPGSSQAGCLARGCIWCETNVVQAPWCSYPSSSVPTDPPAPTPGGGGPYQCSQHVAPSLRVDCMPGIPSSQSDCEAKGCYWCEDSSTGNVPWCSYPDTTQEPPVGPPVAPGECPTAIPVEKRLDCWPGGGASQGNCEKVGCVWCESSGPWCFYNETKESPDPENDPWRIDCMPEGGANPLTCQERGCNFFMSDIQQAPFCYFPEDHGYHVIGSVQDTPTGHLINLEKSNNLTLFGNDMKYVTLQIEYLSDASLQFKFTDANNVRFEVPLDMPKASSKASNPLYDVNFSNDPVFSFSVTRKDTGAVLWDTSIGGLVLSDGYLQIATKLPTNKIYGFGEHEHHSFQHDMNWISYGMFSRDQPPTAMGNLYGVHPFYMGIEEDSKAHGVLLLNSNAQDFTLQPAPALTFRTIGGVLDFYMFLGPSPENVVQQYTGAIGRTFMPPYWSLGFQLSRYGYDSLVKVKETVDRMRSYDIPHDVQFGDIDYMDERKDFTYDPVNYAGLPDYVDSLKSEGMRYIIILDPCISNAEPAGSYPAYDKGTVLGVWINETDGVTPAVGKVWPPEGVVFPDFTNPATTDWWIEECVDFKKVIDFDGLWIDMNEPANFLTGSPTGCPNNNLNNPPYKPRIFGDVLADKTLCMDFKQYIGNHYDVHSLYGHSQSPPSLEASRTATGQRSIVITRSTFPGTGKYAGHWLGDNFSQWSNLHYSIIGMLEMNLFGIPYIGADICGFIGDAQENMCKRWMQLGAFYPFSRNHNGYGYREQDPAVWNDQFAQDSRDVLLVRYTLLPYLYTLFHEAHTVGSTVVRPVMHEFIEDSKTHTVDSQFLWGPALLITPVLAQDATSVDAYFPDARWYDYYTGSEVSSRQATESLNAPMNYIPLHVRGGYVIPTQEPASKTSESRKNPMGLIVALDDNEEARGSLFWDDGESIDTYENDVYYHAEFKAIKGQLISTIPSNSYGGASGLVWGRVRVLGATSPVSSVTINGKSHGSFSYNSSTKELQITDINETISSALTITW